MINMQQKIPVKEAQFEHLIYIAKEYLAEKENLLSLKQAAGYLNISLVSFWRIRKANNLPYCIVGKRHFFRKEILDNYINSKEVTNV